MPSNFVPVPIRRMLTLQNNSSLNEEEIWLKKAYTNIVYRLVQSTITTSSEFDPFVTKFMGINTVEYDKFQYQALLETTSFFWASKGGRGTLLEKIVASLGNSNSSNEVTMAKLISMISLKADKNRTRNKKSAELLIKSNKRLKFDLVNIIGDKIIILELKNRVDSGGTAAREEALSKKFLSICKMIENDEKIFYYNGKDYDMIELLTYLGISEIKMSLGILFDVNGKEATIQADKLHGFYSSSKTLLKNYANESHPNIRLEFDESNIRLSFKKYLLSVAVEMWYGNQVIRNFSSKEYDLTRLTEKVFSKSWDDIWLVFNIAISQRSILLKNRNNHITQLKNLLENDEFFGMTFTKFCNYPSDCEILRTLVEYTAKRMVSLGLSSPPGIKNSIYVADCLYAFASYMIDKRRLFKSKEKADIPVDINKKVLTKG
jgi:hypothetical protein